MVLFRKRAKPPSFSVPPPPEDDELWRPEIVPSAIDWRDVENIKAEWPITNADVEEDLLGWRNGMRMAVQDEAPGQRFNEAEYITRGLRYSLYEGSPLTDDEAAESVRLVLQQLHRAPVATMEMMSVFVPKLVRLALAVMRERGWQPAELGGTGRVNLDLNTPIVLSAIATTASPDGDYLQYFFRG